MSDERFSMSENQPAKSQTTLPAVQGQQPEPLSRDIVKEIAMDIGKAVVAYGPIPRGSHGHVQYVHAVPAKHRLQRDYGRSGNGGRSGNQTALGGTKEVAPRVEIDVEEAPQ